jgi:signal peptidase II
MLWAIIIIIITLLDRAAKILVVNGIEQGGAVTVINDAFYIVHAKNPGAALGIFPGGRYFFIIVTSLISIALVMVLIRTDNKLLKLSLSFIIGGAAGNLIDRVIYGSVTDFMDFYFGSFHFWTFNFADFFVVTGTILLSIYMIFIYDKKKKVIKVIKEGS